MPNNPSSRPEKKPVFRRFLKKAQAPVSRIHHALGNEIRRWYSFNKQKIPMYFMILAGLVFTAFLDFTLTLGGDRDPIVFQSHITAIIKFVSSPLANATGFFLFVLYLIAIIQMFNAITYAKKNAPSRLILINVLTVIQIVFVVLYVSAFFAEAAARPDYVFDDAARRSCTIMIVGASIMTLGAASSWLYVDWHYVKEIED